MFKNSVFFMFSMFCSTTVEMNPKATSKSTTIKPCGLKIGLFMSTQIIYWQDNCIRYLHALADL